MAGEIFRKVSNIGKETTEGTPVAATRKLMAQTTLSRTRAPNLIKIDSGTRDNQRNATLRAASAMGTVNANIAPSEMIEFLLACVQGGVTPVTALGASTWTFKPGNTLDAHTVEWFDGYRAWQMAGSKIEELKLSGAVNADTKLTATYWGRDVVNMGGGITPGLTDRVPYYAEGWELMPYLDAFGATPGTTTLPGSVISWDLTYKNNFARKYLAGNTVATANVNSGNISVSASLTMEGIASAFTEYQNWDTATKRLLRLVIGDNGPVLGTSALKERVAIDIPGAWTAVDLTPEDANSKAYKFNIDYIYDPTNAFGFQAIVQSTRATAY